MTTFWQYAWDMLKTSGVWLVMSFFICGILHAFLRPDALQRSLGNKKASSLIKATVSGMLLPICSCGVVPLTLGLYYSGAYLGPSLAFLVATPVINPAAVILAFALMGPEITLIYLVCGFVLPIIIGVMGNALGGSEIQSPHAVGATSRAVLQEGVRPGLVKRIKGGLAWGFGDLAVQTCRFILVGAAFAAALLAIIPASFIQGYLSEPKFISLLGASVLGAVMYVCALGHIPFVAAMLGAGAAPGIAVTFLLSGVATNFPEMVSIWKLIGKRAVLIYTGNVVIFGLIAGYITNLLIAESFVPMFDMSKAQTGVNIANRITVTFPNWIEVVCAVVVIGIGLYSWVVYFMKRIKNAKVSGA